MVQGIAKLFRPSRGRHCSAFDVNQHFGIDPRLPGVSSLASKAAPFALNWDPPGVREGRVASSVSSKVAFPPQTHWISAIK